MDTKVTVLINTRNRQADLICAIESVLRQDARPDIFVFDDGSTDGTAEIVRSKFPGVRCERVEQSLGIVRARNEAMRRITTPIVLTIDDDCVFVSPRTVSQTLAEFSDERIGAVCIPSINVHSSPCVLDQAPEASQVYVTTTYRGCAHALRRDLFIELGGYRGVLYRQGEEKDYSIRLLDAGYVVRLGNADPLHHLESPDRNRRMIDFYNVRNVMLYAWHNVPFPFMSARLLFTMANSFRAAVAAGNGLASLKGGLSGASFIWQERAARHPVRLSTYRLMRKLRWHGPLPLQDIEAQL